MTALRATYRLMFNERFRFAEARALVPYLASLGVSHVYLPPSFQARAGSAHGYDVVDPNSFSEELGGEAGFRSLCAAARSAGLGVVLDIVPNHMATDDANRYWTAERSKYFDLYPDGDRYRRFFDIDHLAGVRQEDPSVFEETHRLTRSLLREGLIDGVRVDHPDGLADPLGYLEALGAEHCWVEKILDPGERLRSEWPVDGTVGYEFLNDLQALFVDRSASDPLTSLWHEVSGDRRPFEDWAYEAKLEQATTTFSAEVERLRRDWPDAPADLAEALSSLPVYRTYVRSGVASLEDVAVLEAAGIEWVLNGPAEFVTRFQQTTPPVMAKGVEDTAFYRYARLVALNEVGGDPSRFGISVADFHRANLERLEHWPRNLLITSTHDTKRSGDVRARAGALSVMPEEWRAFALPRLHPEWPAESYFLLQNLVAIPEITPERSDVFVEKALREMKLRSSWRDPDLDHERALKEWARSVELDDPFVARLAELGDRMALGQVLLKMTSPGVPDVYHGDEVRDLALVDPDNRRPIDWDRVRNGDQKTVLVREALRAAPSGAYEPIDAGDDVIAFTRDGRVGVAVALRDAHAELPTLPGATAYEGPGLRLTVAG